MSEDSEAVFIRHNIQEIARVSVRNRRRVLLERFAPAFAQEAYELCNEYASEAEHCFSSDEWAKANYTTEEYIDRLEAILEETERGFALRELFTGNWRRK